MCRKCGEPDLRGSSSRRRQRRKRLLEGAGAWTFGGNGTVTACVWCSVLLADHAGYLAVGGVRLPVRKLEQDRVMVGGPYSLWNLVASCGPCNRSRTYLEQEIPEGCAFGVGQRRRAA